MDCIFNVLGSIAQRILLQAIAQFTLQCCPQWFISLSRQQR